MKIKLELELTKEQIDILCYHHNLKTLTQYDYEALYTLLFDCDWITKANITKIVMNREVKKILKNNVVNKEED